MMFAENARQLTLDIEAYCKSIRAEVSVDIDIVEDTVSLVILFPYGRAHINNLPADEQILVTLDRELRSRGII